MSYNFDSSVKADLGSEEFMFGYRGQPYHDDPNIKRSPIYFNHSLSNRFCPSNSKVQMMYYGYKPETAIIECFKVFREATFPSLLKFGKSELSKIEFIKFKVTKNLNLLDLCDDLALTNLRLKADSDILTSTNMEASSVFADAVLNHGYDGILYRTRQGVSHSAVVYSTAKDRLQDHEVVERISLWDAFDKYNILDRISGIRLIDDTTSIEDSLD